MKRGRPRSPDTIRRASFRVITNCIGADIIEKRTGYVFGDYAVHREPGAYIWTVTHVPSGMVVTVYPPLEKREQALDALRILSGGLA